MRSSQRVAFERWAATQPAPFHRAHAWLAWQQAVIPAPVIAPTPAPKQKFMCAACHNPRHMLGRKLKRIDGVRQYICVECAKGSPSGPTEKYSATKRSSAPAPQAERKTQEASEKAEA